MCLTLAVFARELGRFASEHCSYAFPCITKFVFIPLCRYPDDGHVTRRDTTMTFMTFVNCDLFNAYACRSADKCFYEISLFSNPSFLWAMAFSVMGQFAVIYLPPLQAVFQTEGLLLGDLFLIVCLSSTVLLLDTMRKKFLRQYFSDNGRSIFRRRRKKKKKGDAVKKEKGKKRGGNKVNKRAPNSMSSTGSTIRARNVTSL